MNKKVCLVAAVSTNRVIGINNQLPWSMLEDLRHFKELTICKSVIMGRKTYESIMEYNGKVLPNRINIVVANSNYCEIGDIILVNSLEEALLFADDLIYGAIHGRYNEIMIIGGATMYAEALHKDLVDRMYLTHVHTIIEGDTYFPKIDMSQWVEVSRKDYEADNYNDYDYSFVVYDRVR